MDVGNQTEGEPKPISSVIQSIGAHHVNSDLLLNLDNDSNLDGGAIASSNFGNIRDALIRTNLGFIFENAKYFVIKSNNYENVLLSKLRNVWSTPPNNERKLNYAFQNCKNVILVFSVKESGRFCGFAKLLTKSIEYETPIPWLLPQSIDPRNLRKTFRLLWINKSDLPFNNCSHLTNELNEFKEIKIARDGQELPQSTGRQLCSLFPSDSRTEFEALSFLNKTMNSKLKKKRDRNFSQDDIPFPDDICSYLNTASNLVRMILKKTYSEYMEQVQTVRQQMVDSTVNNSTQLEFEPISDLNIVDAANEIHRYFFN